MRASAGATFTLPSPDPGVQRDTRVSPARPSARRIEPGRHRERVDKAMSFDARTPIPHQQISPLIDVVSHGIRLFRGITLSRFDASRRKTREIAPCHFAEAL